MKSIMEVAGLFIFGFCIFIIGFILVSLCAGIFGSRSAEASFYHAIVFSILYLSAVVGISASLILKELKKR